MELGYAHPDDLLKQLTAEQLMEWQAYDSLDPIGNWRIELALASLSSTVMNIALKRFGNKGVKMTAPKDFIPNWSGSKEKKASVQQTVEEMKTMLLGIAAAQNRMVRGARPPTKPPKSVTKKRGK